MVITLIGLLILIIGIPASINLLFKIPATSFLLQAEWDAGDALGYYGAVLSFIGTIVLGALALYQNHLIKADSDKQAARWEERERIENMPRFYFCNTGAGGYCQNLSFAIHNTSMNSAYDIRIYDVMLIKKESPIWKCERIYTFPALDSKDNIKFSIAPPAIAGQDNILIKGCMSCKDKYDITHEYVFTMECAYPNKYGNTTIVEK